jgi:tetratricopeptide (TPR) repeat protein
MRGGYAMAAYSANPDAAQEALRHFGAALAVRPDSGVAWSMVGMIRGALGQYLSARRAADQATERDPTDALSWYFRGRFYAYGNTPESRLVSRQCFERALELDPSFSSAREALDLIEAGKPLEGFGPRRQ